MILSVSISALLKQRQREHLFFAFLLIQNQIGSYQYNQHTATLMGEIQAVYIDLVVTFASLAIPKKEYSRKQKYTLSYFHHYFIVNF